MEKEFIYVAGTVDEAIKNGLADLGLKEEDVKIEVLEGGSAGIFGLFKKEARVKLSPLDSEFKKEDKPKVEEKEVKEVKTEVKEEVKEQKQEEKVVVKEEKETPVDEKTTEVKEAKKQLKQLKLKKKEKQEELYRLYAQKKVLEDRFTELYASIEKIPYPMTEKESKDLREYQLLLDTLMQKGGTHAS